MKRTNNSVYEKDEYRIYANLRRVMVGLILNILVSGVGIGVFVLDLLGITSTNSVILSVFGVAFFTGCLLYALIKYIKRIRHLPKQPIIISSSGMTFPNGKSFLWKDVYYMYFPIERYTTPDLHIILQSGKKLLLADWGLYIGRRKLKQLIRKYSHLPIHDNKYFLSLPPKAQMAHA